MTDISLDHACSLRSGADSRVRFSLCCQILHDFSAIADWVELDDAALPVRSRDPDDDMFIRTAIAGSARWLVGGDKDLLEIQGLPSINILSPADMLKRISA